jgi:hypothetical protein
MYGFHKLREGHSAHYFFHPSFDRHDPSRLPHIRRKPEKKKLKRTESEGESEAPSISIHAQPPHHLPPKEISTAPGVASPKEEPERREGRGREEDVLSIC